MAADSEKKKVMIIAGEASGDLHGARLVSAMQAVRPDLMFCGMGGRELQSAGVELLFDAKKIAVVGIAEVLSHLSDILLALKVLKKRMKDDRPDLLVLIDFPDFNFILAKYGRKLGIPIYYYISPQVWAWRPGRVKTMKKVVDRIGVILPFEQRFFRDRGVDATYVGHPLLDSVKSVRTRDEFCADMGVDPGSLLVGLMPGSRTREVANLLPVLIEAAIKVQENRSENMVFMVPVASTMSIDEIKESVGGEITSDLNLHFITENRYDMMAACDGALVVSGTVTLELALLDTPMVVFYKVSPLTYILGRSFISKDLRYFSLVNLIAGTGLVTELFQGDVTPVRLAEELAHVLPGGKRTNEVVQGLALVREKMGNPGASAKSAELALSLLR